MGGRAIGLLAVLVGATLGVTVADAPAGAQETPPETATVQVEFQGVCEPRGTPYRPVLGSGYATITVPTAVEQGATFTAAVEGVGGPPALSDPSIYNAFFLATGTSPDAFGSTNFPTGAYTDALLTATGAPGTEVVISLDSVTVRWAPPPGYPAGTYGQDCSAGVPDGIEVPPDISASIPIVAPTCLGQPATIVGLPDDTAVAGTARDDVIVAWAPDATITPGGGHDRICARGGDGTLSYADSRDGVLVSLAQGSGGDAGGGTVRFEGIANLQGSPRADGLVGDDGDNDLRGGAGNDVVVGLAGSDILDGGPGRNLLVGDPSDTCANGTRLGC